MKHEAGNVEGARNIYQANLPRQLVLGMYSTMDFNPRYLPWLQNRGITGSCNLFPYPEGTTVLNIFSVNNSIFSKQNTDLKANR
jgi:hypothetical protein